MTLEKVLLELDSIIHIKNAINKKFQKDTHIIQKLAIEQTDKFGFGCGIIMI